MNSLDKAVTYAQVGEAPPAGFQPLAELPFTIIIGLTGVGKSTTLALLAEKGPAFTLLPNRRDLADQIIIASLQQEDGLARQSVFDRVKRFEYTARYRAKYPGGMTHALGQLMINPDQCEPRLIFDGLRGLEEVQHAVNLFPLARFIVLDAPDMVRLTRLLKRGDAFDNTALGLTLAGQNLLASFLSIPDIEAVFDEAQLRQIARMAHAANIGAEAAVKKIKIIVEERRNYDPDAARIFLTRSQHSHPVLRIDTATHAIEEVVGQMAEWLARF
jgi:hypothetical protein